MEQEHSPEKSDTPLHMEVHRTPDEDTRLLINDLRTEIIGMKPQAVEEVNGLLKDLLERARQLREN